MPPGEEPRRRSDLVEFYLKMIPLALAFVFGLERLGSKVADGLRDASSTIVVASTVKDVGAIVRRGHRFRFGPVPG
jgi:hypothetical protein